MKAPPFPGAERAPASCGELFRVFTRLAMQGFGGVLPVAQYHLVERERWMSKAQFVELLSIGQVLPGPNVVNLSLMVGDRFFGTRGALAALAGMVAVPLLVVLVVAAVYREFSSVPVVAGALRGMGAVSAGLVLATALKLGGALRASVMGKAIAAAFTVGTVALIAGLHWPMVWVILGLGVPAVACAWWHLARARTRGAG
jgi:chromate transporter